MPDTDLERCLNTAVYRSSPVCVLGGIIYATVYSFVGKRCFIQSVSGKGNVFTLKLKTHLGGVGGQASLVGKEERRRKRKRRAI